MEDFRPDAQTALMGNHFAKKEYKEVIDVFRRSTVKAAGDKEADRLMIAARAYMRLKQPSEALSLFREVEKLVKPETDLAFQASYYRLLCFFQIEGRHLPDQVDAFLQLYRKSRPEDSRIHTALMMKAETLFSNKETAAAAKVYSEINASARQREKPPGPALSARLVPFRSRRRPGRDPLAQRVHHPLSGGPARALRPRQARQGLRRKRRTAEGHRRFRPPHRRRHARGSRVLRLAGVRPHAPRAKATSRT